MEGLGARRCFCLSKGRDAQLNAAGANAQLREELQALRPVALSKRAKTEGVDDELVEEALDSADPKSALIDLILRFSDDEPLGNEEHDPELRSELEAMRLKALQARAAAEGIGEDAVDDALEGDNPKAALVALILEHAAKRVSSGRGADRMLAAVTVGGETASDALSVVLDHAMDVLEQLSVALPRKSRKSMRELLESVEEFTEMVDDAWCDGVSRCGSDRLEVLVGRLMAVQALQPDGADTDCTLIVTSMLDAIRECGSVVVQCESVLGVDAGSDASARLGALECVRGMSPAGLGLVSESEASLFGVLMGHVCGSEGTLSCEEQLSCWLSVFVLGCRNGVSLVARVDVLEPLATAIDMSVASLGAALVSGRIDGALRVCSAAHLCGWGLVGDEASAKSPPDIRAPFEKRLMELLKPYFASVAKMFSVESFSKVITEVVKLRLLQDGEEASLGCAALKGPTCFAILFPKPLAECDTEALFGGALTLLRNVCPTPLPAEWWVSTCAEVDVTSVRLGLLMQFFGGGAKLLDQATLESASWLGPALAEAVHICKVNASAGLSARPTMSFYAVAFALSLLETAARLESHAASLLDLGVLEALDYACVNDFSYISLSVSGYAVGAAVALVGRNEGGKTLSRRAVNAALDSFAVMFDPTSWWYSGSASRVVPFTRRVATVAIADANKKVMLQHDKLLGSLVAGLLLDDGNPRRGQDGADALQEACAGVLHELALYGPGAAALRGHKPTMDALRVLAESGTKESRERAAGALFELDEETRAAKKAKASDAAPGASKPPPHIMVSYNWDHQHVILRVVAWLQAHGYLVWVDTEQMKGSTVDAMALAVEGSEVMLIGVSRPYKESSNCRMEAQYGLQKKKAMIPLMMQEGYEADGWLGLLLGTSLWYALYGATLESESAFEDRLSALSREIGSRGRADAVVADVAPELCPEADGSGEVAALRAELAGMRLMALHKRAMSEGATAVAVDEAMDGDDPKASLIALIVEVARGPAVLLSSALQAGGETSADTLSAVLDHAMDVLEEVSRASPRKSRKAVRSLLESVEELSESMDEDWCDGVSRCGSDRLEALASRMTAVRALKSDEAEADCTSIVSSLLEGMRECSSVAVQCESVLAVDGSDEGTRLGALECVCGLSAAGLGQICGSEASLFGVLTTQLCSEDTLSCEERLPCWMSVFVLGCRNGVSVVARVDVLEPLIAALGVSVASLAAAVASGSFDEALRVCSAAHLCGFGLVGNEAGPKSAPDARAPLEKRYLELIKPYLGGVAKAFSAESFGKVITEVVELQLLVQNGESSLLGCGALNVFSCFGMVVPKPLAECDTEAVFGGAVTLLRTVCPSPLPAEWWVSTCAEVDVTSVRLGMIMMLFGSVAKFLDQATLESAAWLGPALAEAVHICQVNASAGLSARPTMSVFAFAFALQLVEIAARAESHVASLLDSGVVEALDYACVNDFSYVGKSVSSEAAGAVVALVGRNEGGKTLSRSTVNAVLDGLADIFDPTHFRYNYATARALPVVRRVCTMAIADANKKIMLQHDKLLGSLVTGLLLDDDNPRRGQDGAGAMQEACAGVLHELALYGPGAVALRAHKPTMDALRVLAESGTKESRERAAGALFELDEEMRVAKSKTADAADAEPGASKPPPHIMVSYNWDHQHVILRVVAWLQAHGYLVWVDTEQMKGSTVDAMALAVEGSEVMLIGVSRPYKESSNCRMEAQYGLQKKKAMIPLMMQEGYEADGWLGLLLGTSLWYALYGSTLESESAFEDRMSALSREIGSRGRADAVAAAHTSEPSPQPELGESEEAAALRSELGAMRLTALNKRAASEGIPLDDVDGAMDCDDPKASLIVLIVEAVSSRGPSDHLLSSVTAGGDNAADTLSAVLDHALDVLEQLSVSSPRKARKSILELMESVEELSESVDNAWCDGVSRCKPDRLEALASRAVAVQALKPDTAGAECVTTVSSLLQSLRECGSMVVQCESVLAVDTGSDESARLGALECVRGLSPATLGCVSESEASLFGVLKGHVCGSESALSCEERLSCWLSLFVLGCRNGVSVVGRVDVVEPLMAASSGAEVSLDMASGDMTNRLRATCAADLCSWILVGCEAGPKLAPDARVAFEKSFAQTCKSSYGALAKMLTESSVKQIFARIVQANLLKPEQDVLVACGAACLMHVLSGVYARQLVESATVWLKTYSRCCATCARPRCRRSGGCRHARKWT
eukprot:COSAG04_NODE_122_length_24803_cov_180.609415_5_plen_2220_part_00